MRHLENMAKVMLATGLIVCYGYVMEAFMAWYGDNAYEDSRSSASGRSATTAHTYWMLILCNCLAVSALVPPVRTTRSPSGSSRSSSTSGCGWSGT